MNPALVLPDQEGKPYSVRYEAVNAMLLNEFLKKHRKVAELGLVSRLLRFYLRLGAALANIVGPMTDGAQEPEDLTRLFVQLANNRDARGLAELYESNAVLAFPSGQMTVGLEAIRRLYEQKLAKVPRFEPEEPLPTLRNGDLAMTSTRRRDGKGIRVQAVRRQPDGSWLRIIDWPEPPVG